MATDYWIKLYIEILDDPKMATLPDRLWRRIIELFLMAGRCDFRTGILPETKYLAWILRIPTDELELDLRQIESIGIIKRDGTGWIVCKFASRQAKISDADRQRYKRERDHKREYYGDEMSQESHEPVTKSNIDTESGTDTDTDTEAEAEAEAAPAPAPAFVPQVNQLDYTRVFCKVTGMSCIPGSEIQKVLPALEALQVKYPQEQELIDYLIPFWQNWIKRRTKDGRLYSKTNCTWLYDWAVAGVIPENGNGSIPPAHKAAAEVI